MKQAHLLLDSHNPSSYGGTGEVFDWMLEPVSILTYLLFLLVGLLLKMSQMRLVRLNPFAVDASSGVESAARGQRY